MILLKKKSKREWIIYSDLTGNNEQIYKLDLLTASITNRFDIVSDTLKDLSVNIDGFEIWFIDLITKYIETKDSSLLYEELPTLLEYSKRYLDYLDIDFSSFINRKKVTSTSIILDEDDIYNIVLSSTAMKIYSIFKVDKDLKVPENMDKQIYQFLINDCVKSGVVDKIFQIIRSRVYRSSITDKRLWELIKIRISEEPETYVMSVFNFMMNNLFVMLSPDKNPAKYVVSVIDDSIRWMMCSVYKDNIIFGDSFGGVDDIFGSGLSKESFNVYCCNDVISKAARIGFELLESDCGIKYNTDVIDKDIKELNHTRDEQEKVERYFEYVKDRLNSINYIHPSAKLVILPIASKVLDIPYKYLLTTPPKNVILMGYLLYNLSQNTFVHEFPLLSNFLISYSKGKFISKNKSSYQVKNIEYIINNNVKMFGFESKKLNYDIMCSLCGILSSSKKSMMFIKNNKKLPKCTYSELELEVMKFYNHYYSNKLTTMFDDMKSKIDELINY